MGKCQLGAVQVTRGAGLLKVAERQSNGEYAERASATATNTVEMAAAAAAAGWRWRQQQQQQQQQRNQTPVGQGRHDNMREQPPFRHFVRAATALGPAQQARLEHGVLQAHFGIEGAESGLERGFQRSIQDCS